jgi:hypothetical protein
LAALFDLELDTEKNQYETQKSASSTAEQKAQELDDALKKLDELARREESLAQQQRNGTQTAEQKWQQEMLQREAEQLQRQMEQQLAQQNGQQGQQSGQQGKQGQQSSQSASASGQSGGQGGQGQAAQQALERLRQANDDMKRATSQNASAADSRRAADRLRQATEALNGAQQQDASGRLNSMAQTAEQLAARQKEQADRMRELMSQLNAARASGKEPKYPSAQEIDKMVNERQQVSDDLSRLTQQLRTASRELAPTQPGASGKLRSALDGMDENDLGTRLQRSSDQLRSGEFSDPSETALTSDLQKLGGQVKDAARALGNGNGNGQRTSEEAALNRAMDDLTRLRDQLGALGGQGRQAGQQGGQTGPVGNNAGGGGDRNHKPIDNLNTGDTHISGRAVTPQQGPNPADTQREIEQGLNLLNQVKTVVQDSPEARQQLQSLIDQMRSLDPSRFPGNPALVEQMRQQLVSGVDALELQLRRQLEETRGGAIRNTDPAKVPAGYQDSVAEYYRKLSGAGN